jgi:hypothetical protein
MLRQTDKHFGFNRHTASFEELKMGSRKEKRKHEEVLGQRRNKKCLASLKSLHTDLSEQNNVWAFSVNSC